MPIISGYNIEALRTVMLPSNEGFRLFPLLRHLKYPRF